MIPKQLFFIWLGDNKPNYVDFAVKTFKEVNPDFKVDLLEYTVKQIENKEKVSKYDRNIYNCIDYILNKTKYSKLIDSYINYKRKFIQILANILRIDLLNEYGGIYLDCDTFPVKQFDNNILMNDFCANTYTSYDNENRHLDCCFLGWNINNYEDYYRVKYIDVQEYNYINDINWINKRNKFFECKLNYNNINDSKYYIDHFVDRTWKTNRTPICKYDKYINM